MTRKLIVLSRVSSLAIAVGLTASAAAQSLLGDPTITYGSVNIIEGPSTTDVSVFSPTAVIDWTPDDNLVGNFGAIAFQNSGTTATFRGFEGDYTVLNRINVADNSRRIFMNGTINSFINQNVGGNIFFYSPSGFIIGSSAVINVGSLVLTASPIAVDGNGGFINNGTVVFGQAPHSTALINTVAGSQINALNEGSYVAMIAPRVEHRGSIAVNGGAALVGAEAATITFRPSGLFDIQVTTGTTDANGVYVEGAINGPASSGTGDHHRVYLAAVPKNTAVSMLIANGANLGFDIAGAADVDGNAVVLSAGHNITAGTIDDQPVNAATTSNANISPTTVTSAFIARADDELRLSPIGVANYASDVDVRAGTLVNVFAQSSGILNIAGDLTISTDREATAVGQAVTGGTSWLLSQSGASITIGGDVTISANGSGGSSVSAAVAGGNGTGGSIVVQPFGGSLTIGGGLFADANGFGGSNFADGTGGIGRGGTISIQTAGDNSSLTVDGSLTAHADGFGGSGISEVCGQCTGIGGAGIGGNAFVGTSAGVNNSATFDGDALITADGFGGFGSLHGGDGTGGGRISAGTYGAVTSFGANSSLQFNSNLTLQSNGEGGTGGSGNGGNGTGGRSTTGAQAGATGGTLLVLGDTFVEAIGAGGGSNGSGTGGIGQGGDSDNAGNAGFMDYRGNVSVRVDGTGGYSEGGVGGNAFGGQGWLEGFGADVNVDGNYSISGFAQGGNGATGGGNANGGSVYLIASNANSVVTVDGTVTLDSGATGGSTFTGNGGNAQANLANVRATNGGSVTIGTPQAAGNVFVSGIGTGGDAFGPGGVAGDGRGGNTQVFSFANGTLGITGFAIAIADGVGGYADDATGITGDGFGGLALLRGDNGGQTTVDGLVVLRADGSSGNAIECLACGGTPGNGQGGTAQVQAVGAGSVVTLNSTVDVQANGYGGISSIQQGGIGVGGFARIGVQNGGAIDVDGAAFLDASGFGGGDIQGGDGGDGAGGTATVFSAGTGANSVILRSSTTLTADGLGGNVSGPAGGEGGDGIGGRANVGSGAGNVSFTGTVSLSAVGQGGDATNGLGGDGEGGITEVGAGGGSTIHFLSNLTLNGGANGGSGATGGNASALFSPPENELSDVAAAILVDTGGTILVDGNTSLYAYASGGNATNGDGGSASAGEVDIGGFQGNITLGDLLIDADGVGGNGALGGNGGVGLGGLVDVALGFTTQSVNGTITIGSAVITADGYGGRGGDGAPGGNFGSDGGDGATGGGGRILFTASAAGGSLNSGAATLSASGFGGLGGNGSDGDGGTGGDGGNGGAATGGTIHAGTISTDASPTSGGTATFTTLGITTFAQGGDGGNGGTGGAGDGVGGSGGVAIGGNSMFLVRGILVTADTINLNANALGGDGGTGSIGGVGGDATTGGILVESKDRFGSPDERGFLDANSIVGTAIAIGGNGSVNGASIVRGGSYFRILNGDADIGNVSITISGDTYDPSFGPSVVSVRDGTANLGDFSFVTDGLLILDASNAAMNANSITLAASSFVGDTFNETPPTLPGTYSATTFDISTGNDFITNANLVSVNSLDIFAPGAIIMADGSSTEGDLTLTALIGAIDGGDLTAAGSVTANGQTDVNLLNVTAGDAINVFANSGAISLGNLQAGSSIDLDAAGSILFGNVSADNLDFTSGGTVTGGDIVAGTSATGEAEGAISLGSLNVGIQQTGGATDDGFAVGFTSATSIQVGNVAADESIGFATLGNLTTGTLTGANVMALVGGNMNLGAITTPDTGRTYLADVSMYFAAGGPEEFNPLLVLAAPPVRTDGSILINGPVSTGQFQAAAGTSLTAGSIVAPLGIYLDAGGAINVGGLSSDEEVEATSDTSIVTGNITGPAGISLSSANGVTTGNLQSNAGISIINNGSISTGTIQSTGGGIGLQSGANIATGAVSTPQNAVFDAVGSISIGGNSNVGGFFLADAGSSLTLGGVTANLITGRAGGLAALNGFLQAPTVQLVSTDIAIAANGGIDAGTNGTIVLQSTNANGALIGDGLTGNAYALSNAEFGRLSGGELIIVTGGAPGADGQMQIGDLTITGPQAGSTIESATGGVTFVTLDEAGEGLDGRISVVGDIAATGFGAQNYLEFLTENFELDAGTGSIAITSTGNTLSGELYIQADRIHVAQGDILQRLRDDPNYAGREADLNAPAAAQRPEGVVRAASIDVYPTEALLVQNTGTAALPAGFLTFGDGLLFADNEGATGPIELIINGQLITEGGTLTGVEVRDFLIDESNIGLFTENSMINGCPLTGNCQGPLPPIFTPVPGIQQEITLIGSNPPQPPLFGNEDTIDDNDEETEDSRTSPIVPPQPLFDTTALGESEGGGAAPIIGTPMRSNPGLEQKGDVDDPVSGSGNPALMGTRGQDAPPPPPANQEKQP